jgi:hypothetical protein
MKKRNYSENLDIGDRKTLAENNSMAGPCDHSKKPVGSLKGT